MSDLFDLDTEGAAALDEQARLNPLDLSQLEPNLFAGSDEATKGLMRPSAAAGRALMMAGAVVPQFIDNFRPPNVKPEDWKRGTDAQDWYFKEVVDDLGTDAVDSWTPDPHTMGSAAKALNVVSNVAGSVPQMVGTPGVFLAGAGIDPATELTRQGVDSDTALAVGGVNLLVNAIGLKLPAAFGTTLSARVATGAGSNLALGVGADAASSELLRQAGFEEEAARFNPKDPYARGLDLLMGAAFGWRAHVDASRALTPSQRDAVLTVANDDHLRRRTLPGEPNSPAALRAHGDAMSAAISQVLRGEPVDIAATIRAEDFVLRPEIAPAAAPVSDALQGYVAYRRALESGGRADAANPNSSALGADQFTRGTWLRTVAKEKPAWAEGLSEPEILALRTDPEKSAQMADALDAESAAALRVAGQDVDRHTLYAAHHFGADRGVAFARAAADTPMADLLTQSQLDANAYLKGKTKAQAMANWDARAKRAGVNVDGSRVDTASAGQALRQRLVESPDQLARDYAALEDSQGGVVLNTDTARELSPEYLADRTRSADVHEAASDTVKMLYERKLAAPTPDGYAPVVLFTAGGTGAGKTSAIRAMGQIDRPPEIVYDTNMNTLGSAVDKVEQALAAGRDVSILYVYRDPVDALVGGALPRAERQAARYGTGRTVPLAEHAKTHLGVRPVMDALAERYRDDPRVEMVGFDNSRGKDQGAFADLARLPKVEENSLHERLQEALETEHQAGRISDATRAGFQAPGRDAPAVQRPAVQVSGREPESQRQGQRADQLTVESPVDAAARLAADTPDLSVIDGFDADGAPLYRSLSEALDNIEAERQRAAQDAQGFVAAVSCFLRRGG